MLLAIGAVLISLVAARGALALGLLATARVGVALALA